MAGTLTKFGVLCRSLRLQNAKNMADQARVFGCEVQYISSIESGKIDPTEDYIEKFRAWLDISRIEYQLLVRRGKSNVISLTPRFSTRNNSTSMRLFRKVSKLDPNQIRAFKKQIEVPTEAGE
jgi:transcriptional regulator with XRE-family HTH domain